MNNPVKDFFESIADHWDNKNDNREIIEELFKEIDIKENEDVLDLGCGKGIVTPFIYKYTNKKVILSYYFVPYTLSPASPRPGNIYPTSFNCLSTLAQYI